MKLKSTGPKGDKYIIELTFILDKEAAYVLDRMYRAWGYRPNSYNDVDIILEQFAHEYDWCFTASDQTVPGEAAADTLTVQLQVTPQMTCTIRTARRIFREWFHKRLVEYADNARRGITRVLG